MAAMATKVVPAVFARTSDLKAETTQGAIAWLCRPSPRQALLCCYKPSHGWRIAAKQGGILLEKQESYEEEDEVSEDDVTTEEEDSDEDVELGFENFEFQEEEELNASSEAEVDALAERARKIDELCATVRSSSDFRITSRHLISLYDFPLDKFQRLAIEGFLKGSSVVVSAPTSSGKTLIAEAAAAATLARCRRLFYTTPLKALSNQKFREFRSVFGEASVGLLTGDVSFNRDAPIVIMTAEILRNKLYLSAGNDESAETLVGVDVVVLDEIHYLSDISRGTVWEETVIYCPKDIQLICLSATIANPEELAGWIAKVHGPTELITSSKRPVPLMWHISRRSGMLPILNSRGTGMNKNLMITQERMKRVKKQLSGASAEDDPVEFIQRMEVPRISETLKQMAERKMLPAIWFILSRRRCDEAVGYLHKAGLLSDAETKQVQEALKRFREQHPEGVRDSAVGPLYQGVAAHHAGCLPVWKTFIEELFQRGLVKVVFATETLAAGINMPARTTVLSSSVARGGAQTQLSANSILQMAGRAGRRGIDTLGHVVVVQTPFRGPKDCYKMLRAGADPLISQFTANYGMVLNLLAGSHGSVLDSNIAEDGLAEARSLVEKSFGNYIGSEILLGSRAKLTEIQAEINSLEAGNATDSLSRLYDHTLRDYKSVMEKFEMKKRKEATLSLKIQRLKSTMVENHLNESLKDQYPYVCLSYPDSQTGEDKIIPSVYVDKLSETEDEVANCQYLSFGVDSYWYRFSENRVKSIHKGILAAEQQQVLRESLPHDGQWERLSDGIFILRNSSSSLLVGVPEPNGASELDSEELQAAEKLLLMQQKSLAKAARKVAEFDHNEMARISGRLEKLRKDKIARLKSKSERIANRIKQMQPSGWNEFVQAVEVLKVAGAMHPESFELLPLGEMARAMRGTNELWLAMALKDETLTALRPSELAAVAACLVTESAKLRSEDATSTMYEPSDSVKSWVERMQSQRQWLMEIQEAHNLVFACELEPQLAGFVEAWASGVNWKELEVTKVMDEGDFARLLRRTIDLLSQVPHLPHIDQALVKASKEAAKLMDRPPISEPVAE